MPKFSIKPNTPDRYSNTELRILGALRNGRCNALDLLDIIYGQTGAPENAARGINTILVPLRRKVDRNKEDFAIMRNDDKHNRKYFDYWLVPRTDEALQNTSTDEGHTLEANL